LLCRYPVYLDSGIKIRALNSPFSNDPHWIAYFKVGGCGELASVFCEVANQVGLETRVVGTEGEEHAWNEVKIGDWKHIDPTIYYLNYTSEWFDNPQFYEEHWFHISKVFVERTGEDVTQKYTDVGILNMSSTKLIDKVSITALKKGKKRLVCSEEVNASSLNIELGGKIYNVTGERDLIPFLISRQDVKEVNVVEGEEASVELSPEKLAFKPCFYIICYIVCFTLLISLIYKLKFKNQRMKRKNCN
jgi:hypothetical protein